MGKLYQSGQGSQIKAQLELFQSIPFPDYDSFPAIDYLHERLIVEDPHLAAQVHSLIFNDNGVDLSIPTSLYEALSVAKRECPEELNGLLERYELYIAQLQHMVDEVNAIRKS